MVPKDRRDVRPYGHRTGRCILSMAAMALSIGRR